MFKKKPQCSKCESKLSDSFDFCPYCGLDLRDPEKDARDFGMLGKNEMVGQPLVGGLGGLGITDKMINSLMRNLMNSLNKQMGNMNKGNNDRMEVQNFPNGINIKFGVPVKKVKKTVKKKRGITQEQIQRMSGMPRAEAKTNVRRLSDRVVYELKVLGVENAEDIFVSKLESGYEVKAIGKKKVYVNSIPVNLPLRGYGIGNSGIFVEFGLG